MKHKTAFITSIILTGGILAAIASSIAWFDHKTTLTPAILQGSTQGAYFGGGNGTKDTPYLIKNQRHLYNLAWLQYLGEFNKTDTDPSTIDKQYYFKRDDSLKDSGLDRKDFVLPPIGTESNPFLGNFDGNNVTINNLTVSNNFNDLNKHPYNVTSDSFSKENIQIVGFFGIIGSHNTLSYSYSSVINSVSNLYLNNVTINTSSNNTLCGIFAGYANASISYCGVHYATIKIGSNVTKIDAFNNVSSYTLIGDYNQDGYEWEDKPGGDVGYGTSTDIKSLHLSLISNNLKDGDVGKIGGKTVLPFKSESTDLITSKLEKFTITKYVNGSTKVTQSISGSYSTYKASTKGNNIGYYSGEVKTYDLSNKNLDYDINDFGIQQQGSTTNHYLKTPPAEVLSYLKQNGSYLIRRNNGYSSDNLQGSTFNYAVNAQVGDWTGNLLIPSDGIWVAPKTNGTFKFVFYNDGFNSSASKTKPTGIIFAELQRTEPGNYSSPFIANSLVCSGLSYYCKYGYFEKEAEMGKEYFITYYNSSNFTAPYIAYLDIGANGGGSTTDKGSISKLDFVTADANEKLTKLTDPGYTTSNSFFSINGTSSSEYVYSFRRINDSILYYVSPIGSGFTITELGTGTKKKTDNADCKS